MKRTISWASIMSLLASLSLFTASLANADSETLYLPDYVVFHDYLSGYYIDYTDYNDYSTYGMIPIGGNGSSSSSSGDELYIGSTEPFDGITIEVGESRFDGEYTLTYFESGGTFWNEIEGAVVTELDGTVTFSWDNSDWGWDPHWIIHDYNATDPDNSEAGSDQGYFVKLETTQYSEEEGYAWANGVYIRFNDETTSSTTEEEEEEVTTTSEEVTWTTVSTPTFSDLPSYDDHFAAIEYLVHIGTLQGYSDGTFLPDATVNRAELMKILVAGQELDPSADTYKNCFPDVTTEWFARYVCYAKEQGWVDGYPDGTFQPGNTVNKAEAIKMVINALGFGEDLPENLSGSLFSDVDAYQWYSPYLYVAKSMVLIEEYSGMYYPADGMTRGTVSENVFRGWVLKQMGEDTYYLSVRNDFFDSMGFEVVETDAPVTTTETAEETQTTTEEDDYVYLNLTSSSSDMTLTIENLGDSSVDLNGYSLETSSTFYTFGSYTLAPGESVELDYYYPGETVYLRDDSSAIIETDYNS